MPRLLHITDFQARANTGVAVAVNALIDQARSLAEPPEDIRLACVGDIDLSPASPAFSYPLAQSKLARSWRYSPTMAQGLDCIIRDFGTSIVHTHGAWFYPQMAAAAAAARAGIPSVLTNHGMFSTWAMGQPGRLGALKKRLYLKAFSRALFDRITVYHAITLMDRDAMRVLFPGKRIEVIPNSVDTAAIATIAGERRMEGEPYIFFCGRLHQQKGLDNLIKAFGAASIPNNLRLLIVGPDENPTYALYIRKLVEESPRRRQIELLGSIWAPERKYALMRDALVTAVPSRHEVVSIVNLESSACNTPTITTHPTGLADWEEGGGLLIEADVTSLVRAIEQAVGWSDAERKARGEASRRLVEKRYSTAVTGRQWMDLYGSL